MTDSQLPCSADIVERLRVWPAGYGEDTMSSTFVGQLMKHAANEIERLRPYIEAFRREESRADKLGTEVDELRERIPTDAQPSPAAEPPRDLGLCDRVKCACACREALEKEVERLTRARSAPAAAVEIDVLSRLVDWTYLHATEGEVWPSSKTKADLITRASQDAPRQEHADGMKAVAPQRSSAGTGHDLSCAADFLDDIEVDEDGKCHWTAVANAQTHIRAALRCWSAAPWPADTPEGREVVARMIYNAFPYDGTLGKQKPEWIPNGNSFWQDKARATAGDIICAVRPHALNEPQTLPTREKIARTLAYEEWPLAMQDERQRWSDRNWEKWLRQADSILALTRPVRGSDNG